MKIDEQEKGSALDEMTENEHGSFYRMKPFAEASTSEEPNVGKIVGKRRAQDIVNDFVKPAYC